MALDWRWSGAGMAPVLHNTAARAAVVWHHCGSRALWARRAYGENAVKLWHRRGHNAKSTAQHVAQIERGRDARAAQAPRKIRAGSAHAQRARLRARAGGVDNPRLLRQVKILHF